MVNATASQAAGAVLLGIIGLWLAHSYRRQIKLKLAERQADAHIRLWELTGIALPDRATPLESDERHRLYDEMLRWYIDKGNGIFLSVPARSLYIAVRTNLMFALNYGYRYFSNLRPDDRALLRSCGLSPWRRPWRRRPLTRSGRASSNPCVCQLCPIR